MHPSFLSIGLFRAILVHSARVPYVFNGSLIKRNVAEETIHDLLYRVDIDLSKGTKCNEQNRRTSRKQRRCDGPACMYKRVHC